MIKIKKLSNISLFYLLILIFFSKILIYILLKNEIFTINLGGSNDADYYDSYAKGYVDIVVNIWPVILRYFDSINLYSREFISIIFMFLNLLIIPLLVCKLADLNFKLDQKKYLSLYLICLIYPTLFYYSFDIYRDVFMVFVFLLGCIVVKKTLNCKGPLNIFFYYSLSLSFGIFLLALRPYLGYAFILALLLWKIKFTKRRILFLGLLYLITLFSLNYIGALDFLNEYRNTFEDMEGRSNLGLDFSNPLMFIPNFAISVLGQLFGLYVVNLLSILILIIETIPFVYMLGYVIKNIKLANGFLRFLIIFFVLYGSVWLIGNDNLGTALRLRMYNYLAIYICFFHIIKFKSLSKSNELRNSYL